MVDTAPQNKKVQIIVNADDYGYFNCVSNGIIEAAKRGIVTATGILANNDISTLASSLINTKELDAGVHLNLTYGSPISKEMSNAVMRWNGHFPPLFTMAPAIMRKIVKVEFIEKEFRAQIEKCLENNLELLFLNSHEHIHMLPMIYPLTIKLANEYSIPFVRHSNSEWIGKLNPGSLLRNTIFSMLNVLNAPKKLAKTPQLIGMTESGQLSINYFKKRFTRLKPGKVYELMCHPGYFDKEEISDQKLLNYHRWEDEFSVLTSDEFANMCYENKIELIGYRDLLENSFA